jgi:hypothetical protein
MILVVRPVSVLLSLTGDRTSWGERVFLSFLAPRGIVAAAVSSVFALKLAAHFSHGAGAEELLGQADQLVSVTFLVIVSTVTFYGLLSARLARWLNLADANPQGVMFAGADPWVVQVAKLLQESGFDVMLVDTNYSHVARAKMEGLQAECASVLSEYVHDEMDLSGLGRLLAITPNDEVNTLAVGAMAHLFGRRNVYQIAPDDTDSERRQSVGVLLRGRELFDGQLTTQKIEHRLNQGAIIKKTSLGDEFDFEDFQERYGPSAVILFVMNRRGGLSVCTAEEPPAPESGDTLIALVPEIAAD